MVLGRETLKWKVFFRPFSSSCHLSGVCQSVNKKRILMHLFVVEFKLKVAIV